MMKTLAYAIIIVVAAITLAKWTAAQPAAASESPSVANAEPLVTVVSTPMPTAAPLVHAEAQRMQFARGTYGGTYDAGTWVLWARQGQTLTLSSAELVNALLSAPDGNKVLLEGNKAALPASGDYLLTVAGIEQFGIDIR